MINYTISKTALLNCLNKLNDTGYSIIAPVRQGKNVLFRQINNPQSIVFDYIQTTESPKDVVFPRIEPMLKYKSSAGNVEIVDFSEKLNIRPVILFGSRPCDAVALKRLVDFFADGVGDAFVEQRAEQLIVISIACTEADDYCFCTSVGLSPYEKEGSDLLLTPIENERFFVEGVTERGKKILESNREFFEEQSQQIDRNNYTAKIQEVFSAEKVTNLLRNAFDHPYWNEASLRCLGCGACAYVCPLCSCFDIQDEGTTKEGIRLRCWDSCGFALFTLHTSGHNPRHIQSERWRQRIMHKFSYLPDKMNLYGCAGCGRCSRACSVDMNLKEQLITINEIFAKQ